MDRIKHIEILNELWSQIHRQPEDIAKIKQILAGVVEFHKFFETLSTDTYNQFCSRIWIENYGPGYEIFSKGQASDKFYVILQGTVKMIDTKYGTSTEVQAMKAGKAFGERGILLEVPRSLTAQAKSKWVLLVLTASDFLEILGDSYSDQKLEFVERHIPNTQTLTQSHKDRITYAMYIQTYYQNHNITIEGQQGHHIYYVYDGEWAVVKRNHEFLKLSWGAYFGEEAVLMSIPYAFTIRVTSKTAQIFAFDKTQFHKLIPFKTIEGMRNNFRLRIHSRMGLSTLTVSPTHASTTKLEQKLQKISFPNASLSAKKKLLTSQSHRRLYSENQSPSNGQTMNSQILMRSQLMGRPQSSLANTSHGKRASITTSNPNQFSGKTSPLFSASAHVSTVTSPRVQASARMSMATSPVNQASAIATRQSSEINIGEIIGLGKVRKQMRSPVSAISMKKTKPATSQIRLLRQSKPMPAKATNSMKALPTFISFRESISRKFRSSVK